MNTPDLTLDEYFNYVGKIMHAAALADVYMFFTFFALVQSKGETARAIYFSLDAMAAKEKMVRRVAKTVHCDERQMNAVENIIKHVKKANEQRTEFAHALAANDPETGVLSRTRFKVLDLQGMYEPMRRDFLEEKLRITHEALAAADRSFLELVGLRRVLRAEAVISDAALSPAVAHHQNDPVHSHEAPDQIARDREEES
jgi:hypothetical protein